MAAAHSSCPFIFIFTFTLLLLSSTTSAHNITNILSSFPDYSLYTDLLTKTKVADDINSRQTITVLVMSNSVVSSTLQSHPLDVLKAQLSIHVLLDYFDSTKLQNIKDGSIITTLYQTSGVASQRNGFVNITDSDGKVLFSSATEGSKPNSVFVKSVKAVPYNISVLQISAPIDAPGVLNPSPSKDVNLTAALAGAGAKTFAKLIAKGKFAIVPEASGDFVLLKTGVDTARVKSTILDSAPVSLFLIDNVLLPVELSGNSSTQPPSGSPIPSLSPASPTPSPQPGAPASPPPGSPQPLVRCRS